MIDHVAEALTDAEKLQAAERKLRIAERHIRRAEADLTVLHERLHELEVENLALRGLR